MSELAIHLCIMVVSVFISSVSQVMLKKSAQKKYPSKIREYLNPVVIIAYALFFGCTFITMYALRVVPLSTWPVIEASGYIFVAVLSFIFLKEKLSKRQLAGMAIIVAGIIIFSM